MLYEFQCDKCGGITAAYFPMSMAPKVGATMSCKCDGVARRIFSQVQLRPEFFEYNVTTLSKPMSVSSRRQVEKMRRDEYIKATDGTKLAGTNGKLQYNDKYMKQDLKRKEKQRKEGQAKAWGDKLVKVGWGKGKDLKKGVLTNE